MSGRASSLEREALALATNGFTVFPVTPNRKAPPLVRFTKQATTDPLAVASMWREYPSANIGVRPGGGTLILDADSRAAMNFLGGLEIPDTTTVATPRGGRHLYLQGRAPTKTAIRPGLDVRGARGYALGPGSVIGGKHYKWITPPWEIAPQPAPAEVLKLVNERETSRAMDSRPIAPGRRNTELTRIAGFFVGRGVRGDALGVGLQAVNRARCKPPLGEKEVERIVTSANKWHDPPMWIVDPMGFAEDPSLDATARHVLLALASRAKADGHVRGGVWLAEVTGRSRRTIYRSVEQLEGAGRVRVRRAQHQGLANDYRLLPKRPHSGTGGSP